MSGADEDRPGREVAYRLFAAEYDDATVSYAESDEERAPNYVIAPTGARVNRLFAVGTLTEVTRVNEEMLRARVVDPTGAFVVYAGQYQPDERAFLERAEPPAFVAVTGKARTFEPEDSDRVYTSIRPESIATVDAATRDRWVVTTAEHTVDRIGAYAAAADLASDRLPDALREAGLEPGLAEGIPIAMERYGTTPTYLAALRDLALDAVRVVAGERDEVAGMDVGPADERPDAPPFAALAGAGDVPLESPGPEAPSPAAPASAASAGAEPDEGDETAVAFDEDDGATAQDGDPATATAGAGTDGESPGGTADADASEDDDLGDFESGGLGDEMYEIDDEERERIEEEFGTDFSTGSEVDEPGESDLDAPTPAEPADETSASAPDEAGATTDSADAATTDESAADAEGDVQEAGEADVDSAETDVDSGETDADEPGDDDGGVDEEAVDESAAEETGAEDETDEPADEGTDESVAAEEAADEPATGETDESAADEDEGSADETDVDSAETDADPGAADVDLETYVVDRMQELDEGAGADREELVETVIEETGADREAVEDAIQDALMGGQCYEPDDETLKPI